MSGGGGYKSRPHVEKSVKTGAGNRGVSVGAVGQLGQKQGSHTTDSRETSYRGDNRGHMHQGAALRPALMGNEKALDVGRGGPGTGRTTYDCGSQSQHGDVAGLQRPQGRDILNNE
jgi:hypothetical protein